MKLRKFLCMVLASVIVMSNLGTTAEATWAPVQGAETYAIAATGRFNMDIPGDTLARANSSFPLEAGEVVTIKASYTPFSADVDFGLIAPDGLFYGLNAKNGSFDEAIEVNQRGYYTLAIKNNSSSTVSVSGYVNY